MSEIGENTLKFSYFLSIIEIYNLSKAEEDSIKKSRVVKNSYVKYVLLEFHTLPLWAHVTDVNVVLKPT